MDSFIFEYKDYFQKRIQQIEPTASSADDEFSEQEEELFKERPDVSVTVRIRPLTDIERDGDHIEGVLGHGRSGVVNIYEPKKKFHGKPELNSSSFTLDEVYGPGKSTEYVYNSGVSELVQWGLEGGTSMLLAYGQTGSGKTYTVTGIEKLMVDKLIEGQASGKKEVRICIFEVSGSSMFDLLNKRNPLAVREDVFGTMQLGDVIEKNPRTSLEFLELIETAKALRSTASTTKNDQSSRSHSICRIRIFDTESTTANEGSIMLVDLAGSEASSDTSNHTKERMVETREINKSLNVLKECISKRAQWSISRAEGSQQQKHIHVPFRSNKLTQVLKSAFDVNNTQTCKTLVIACIAPSIVDVAHSKNTLRYAETLKIPVPKAKPLPFHELIPTTWSNQDVHNWIIKNSGKAPINPQQLAPKETGIQICKLPEEEFARRCLLTTNVAPEQAKLLYFKLWSLHIDSRALLNRPGGSVPPLSSSSNTTNPAKPNGVVSTTKKKKKTIKPGMFFRVKTGDTKENFDVVMAMGLEKAESGANWICAAVCLAVEEKGAWEVFVAKQAVVKAWALTEEMILEYDPASRYYYIKD